jgi:hypothetical protein
MFCLPGTLISIFKQMDQFDTTGTLNIFNSTRKIRWQRHGAIEKTYQFEFVFKSLLEYLEGLLLLPRNPSWNEILYG